jgi:hypothetical protein
LSAKEREALMDDGEGSILSYAAKNLRFTDNDNDPTKGSELAEIALYGILKRHYNALPVVPKIFYKQNRQDPAKGADSVHIVIENGNDFSLWFGEAKFYNSIEDDRLGAVIDSVGNSLDPEKLKKENSIITNIKDLELLIEDKELLKNIYSLLDNRTSTDDLKAKIHIPILLLHECAITKDQKELTTEYKEQLKKHHLERAQSYFSKQIKKLGDNVLKYGEVKFHIILFPIPDKQTIVETFLKKAEAHRA